MESNFQFGTVRRCGKVFHADIFPDKGCEYTPEDNKRLVENFQPVPVKIEHTDTVFDGKLGQLVHLGADANYQNIYGAVEWPEWLDSVLSDSTKKVSIRTDRDKTRITELSLVVNPRIPDANLNSLLQTAFSTYEKDQTMPVTLEELVQAKETLLKFSNLSPEEKTKLGFSAESPPKSEEKEPEKTQFASVDDVKDQQWYKDLVAQAEEAKRLKNQFAQSEAERLKEKAAAQVETWFNAGKITKEQKESVFASYHRALQDDAKDLAGGIQFSSTSPARADQLKTVYDSLIPVGLDHEVLRDGRLLENSFSGDDMDALRKRTEEWAKSSNQKGAR